MATHSSTLAWRIPWTEEPGGLQSMGSQSERLTYTHRHTHTHLISTHSNITILCFKNKYFDIIVTRQSLHIFCFDLYLN